MTSTSKTTVLRVAASVWGQPDERKADKTIHSWNATPVYIEQVLGALHGLPALLDETKLARAPYVIDTVIYQLAEGHGRGRGDVKRFRATKTWKTIGLSTGETPAVTFTKSGGTKTRVLEVLGKPLGEQNGELAIQLRRGIREHFGHAGPQLVRWLQAHRTEWPQFTQRYRDLVDAYTRRTEEREASRLAEYVALVAVTVELAACALDLPWAQEQGMAAVDTVWQGAVREAVEARVEEAAMRDTLSWVSQNRGAFYWHVEAKSRAKRARSAKDPLLSRFDVMTVMTVMTDGDAELRLTSQQSYGRWDVTRDGKWSVIQIYPHALDEMLHKESYDPDEVKRKWRDRGWIACDKDDRLAVRR